MSVQQQEQKTKRELATLQILSDIREVMGTPSGRRLVWWVLDQANIFRSCFTGNSSTFYNEGMRDIGLRLFRLVMKAAPKLFQQAQNENWKDDDPNGNSSNHGHND